MAKEEKKTTGNVVMKKFNKDQDKEDRRKRWKAVEEATQAARIAFVGNYEPDGDEKTVSFDKAVGDLIEVLQKVKAGEVKLGGLGGDKLELTEEG